MVEPTRIPEKCPTCGYDGVCFTIAADRDKRCEVHCGSGHDPDAEECNWSMSVAEDEHGNVSVHFLAEEITWTPGS